MKKGYLLFSFLLGFMVSWVVKDRVCLTRQGDTFSADKIYGEVPEKVPSYTFLDGLNCVQTLSSQKDNVDRGLRMSGLKEGNIKVVFGDGSGASPMEMVYEDEETLVFQLVADWTGSTDVITLDKKRGLFSRTASGNLMDKLYAFYSLGYCK